MVRPSHGLRRRGRNILRKTPRNRGLSPITHEFQVFENGEKAFGKVKDKMTSLAS